MEKNDFRHELKFSVNKQEAAFLKKQLGLVCKLDPHSVSDEYSYDIRSLYFDNVYHNGYYDKINGVEYRKKYRIRMYNQNTDVLKFECKYKINDMTLKKDSDIDLKTAKHLINKEYNLVKSDDELVNTFLTEARISGLKPSIIVDYRRLAYVYPVSEVRITFDENISSGGLNYNMFLKRLKVFPVVNEDFVEMEVKYNSFIPEHILCVLNSVNKCRIALSKYALSYEYK